jgi:glycosyltransferase involved in cell wall biosynthesis
VAETRNTGFKASKGEFIQFLDADDRLTSESVEAHLRCFAAHPEAGFVVGEIEWIDEINQTSGRGWWPPLEENWYEELLRVNHVANTVAVLFRRRVLETVGGFKGFFSPAEDYEMLVRAAHEFPSAHHTELVSQYRRHTTNTSRRGGVMLKATHRVMVAQLPLVQGSPRLQAAWRAGDHNWRDFFGAVTIKEIAGSLRRGDLVNVIKASGALAWYVRGRIFVIPWKYRRRAAFAVWRRLRRFGRSLFSHFSSATAPVPHSRPSDPGE